MVDHKIYELGSKEGLAEALRRISEARETGAEKLDLAGLGLTELPDDEDVWADDDGYWDDEDD